jgi:DNA uptake protein ComE-like DNA-binding protein
VTPAVGFRRRPRHAARRSFIMLAVLVVMLSAMLVATGLLFVAQTEAAGATGAGDAAQARALVWSGAQVVMSRLAEQRERILAGEVPVIDPQIVVYESDSRSGIVRLLPVGPSGIGAGSGTGGANGAILLPEAGKLDLNRIEVDGLVQTGLIDPGLASEIIAWRARLGRPVQSIEELLAVPGVTVETLFGSIEPLLAASDASAPVDRRAAAMDLAAPARGLADVLTGFSVEPNVQSRGKLRINLNTPWSDELSQRVRERFGADAAALLQQIFASGAKFEDDAAIIKGMRTYNTPPEDWPAILDAFTVEKDELLFGRLDINTAPREALLALPGLTVEQAAQMVSMRQELSHEERATIAWPVTNQIISPEAFEKIAAHITTRCWTYRLRIAAGEVSADDLDGAMTSHRIHELVIDLAGPQPRIAYLRDVTLLEDAALIALEASQREPAAFTAEAAPGAMETIEPEDDASERGSPTSRPNRNSAPARPAATRSDDAGSRSPDEGAEEQGAAPASPRRIGRWTSSG